MHSLNTVCHPIEINPHLSLSKGVEGSLETASVLSVVLPYIVHMQKPQVEQAWRMAADIAGQNNVSRALLVLLSVP